MAKKRATPALTKKPTKDRSLRIRVTQEQKDAFEAAAMRTGLTVSSWIVSLAWREARKADGGTNG